MAGYKRKVRDWTEAGLITAPQADAIFAWEKDRKAGKFGRGLVGLGIFAILTGILSIIAANWEAIPATVKIGAHLLLNAGVAGVAWHAAANGKEIVREGAALAFFVLTVTLIILVGQVFQLDGTLTGLSVTWMIITLPFMVFFSHHYMTAIPWMLAFIATIMIVLSEHIEMLPRYWQMFFAMGVGTLLPLGMIADGGLKVFQRWKPVYADVFTRTGFLLLAFNGTMASFYWFSPRGTALADAARESSLSYAEAYLYMAAIFAVAFAGIAMRVVLARFFSDEPERKAGMLFCAVTVAIMAMTFLIPGGESSFVAAILFIAYWIFIGWIGQQLAWSRLISLAIVLIAIRIFAIYVEVFGDMLSTGIGLIVGGAVLLGLITLARKMNKRLTALPGGGLFNG